MRIVIPATVLVAAVAIPASIGLVTGPRLHAQTPNVADATKPAFEVASVKPNPLRSGIRGHSFPGDRFVATNVPLRDLVVIAYGKAGQPLPDAQLLGGPSWIDSDRFDISATVGGDGLNGVAQKQLMLRALLTERFKLVVHTETRNLPIYALVLARKDRALGPQLHHSDIDCEALLASAPGRRERCILYALPSGKLILRGQTMNALANAFTSVLERVVIDQTGLTGGFDADAEFNPEGLPGMAAPAAGADRAAATAPSLFTAIKEQLGLKLESTKGPVDVLVIDHAEQPTPD
jgi:uncharacterized protein (TIGR03435 family)